MRTLKQSLAYLMIFFCLSCFLRCSNNPRYNEKVIEKYCRNEHYGNDSISFREKGLFTRKDCRLILCKNYSGIYRSSNDTIYFEYRGRNKPTDELPFALKKTHSIIMFLIYDCIKKEYSNLSAEELKKIDKKVLFIKDTASIDYKLVK
jgi:hypothetical protein